MCQQKPDGGGVLVSVAITNYNKLSGLNDTDLSHSSGVQKFKIEMILILSSSSFKWPPPHMTMPSVSFIMSPFLALLPSPSSFKNLLELQRAHSANQQYSPYLKIWNLIHLQSLFCNVEFPGTGFSGVHTDESSSHCSAHHWGTKCAVSKRGRVKMGTGDDYQFLLYHMTTILWGSWLYIYFKALKLSELVNLLRTEFCFPGVHDS